MKGTTTMQHFDASRLGFSSACLAGKTLAEAAEIGLELGFRCYEMLGFDHYRHSQGVLRGFYFEHMSPAERDELRAIADRFDHVSTHAPFIDMPTVAPNPSIRAAAQHQLEIAIDAIAFLGGSTTTTHITPKHIYPLVEFKDEVVELYRRLGDRAAAAGVTVTIETGYPTGVAEFADLIWSIGHPAVGANVDVGHLRGTIPAEVKGTPESVALYNDRLEEHIRSLSTKLFHVHLHDARLSDFRDHRAAGRGFLDYRRVFRVLGELDYAGFFALELEEPDLIPALAESKACIEAAMAAVGGVEDTP